MRLLDTTPTPVGAPAYLRTSVVDAGADVVVTVELAGAGDRVDAVVRGSVLELSDAGEVRASLALPIPVEPGPAQFLRDDDLLTITLRKAH